MSAQPYNFDRAESFRIQALTLAVHHGMQSAVFPVPEEVIERAQIYLEWLLKAGPAEVMQLGGRDK